MFNPMLLVSQGYRSNRILSQYIPHLTTCLRNGLGRNYPTPLSKLQPLQGHSVALYSSRTLYTPSENIQTVLEEPTPEQHNDKSITQFNQLDTINPLTKRSLERVFQYNEMSAVQMAILPRLPNQNDIFVKAKTGTGKTLTFLVAALETCLAGKSKDDIKHMKGTSIIVISPTRELAYQIAAEAEKLTKFYLFDVHCLVGGENRKRQLEQLLGGRGDIVVATPGRLNDLLSSEPLLKLACENLKVLVLDEADQLLDMGFKQELQNIIDQLPKKRQTMLYSATLSKEIRQNLGNFALLPRHDIIDTVKKDDINTHVHVKQSALVAPYEDQLHLLQYILEKYTASRSGMAIIFLPTAKQAILYAQLIKYLTPHRIVYELHSHKPQYQRTKIANQFRKSLNGILVTTDVSARGVDYPGVSLVVQIGVPSSKEQYIHRLGRTGRAGLEGEGIIMLAPFETEFLTEVIDDLPVEKLDPPALNRTKMAINERAISYALRSVDQDAIRESYMGYIGYYCDRMPGLGKHRSYAIHAANQFLDGIGITEHPHLSMGFKKLLGLARLPSKSGEGFDDRRRRQHDDDDVFNLTRQRDNDDFNHVRRRDDDVGFYPRRRRNDDDDDFNQRRRRRHDDDDFKQIRRRCDGNVGFNPRRRRDDDGEDDDNDLNQRRRRRDDDGFNHRRYDNGPGKRQEDDYFGDRRQRTDNDQFRDNRRPHTTGFRQNKEQMNDRRRRFVEDSEDDNQDNYFNDRNPRRRTRFDAPDNISDRRRGNIKSNEDDSSQDDYFVDRKPNRKT